MSLKIKLQLTTMSIKGYMLLQRFGYLIMETSQAAVYQQQHGKFSRSEAVSQFRA
jgi:hypothetical protein